MERRLVRAAAPPVGPGKRLIDDAAFRAELELCHKWGIPHSQWRGHGDGTWTDLDRRKALAYADYLKQLCPQCGTRPQEWDETAGGDEDAYRATTHRCIGCQLIADKQTTIPSGDEGHGVKVFLIPSSVHAALQLQRTHTH